MKMSRYTLDINYDLDRVLQMAECSKADKKYPIYKAQLIELIDAHLNCLKPVGYVVPTTHKGEAALFCLVSLGEEIDAVVKNCFDTYDYLGGMMMNAFGDEVLFKATEHLYDILNDLMATEPNFLSTRIEPGTSDADMSMQKVIYDEIVPKFDLDIRITEGFMLAPAKTLAYYYKITKEDCSNGIDHDCSVCGSLSCKQRKFIIKVHHKDSIEHIQARRDENLLEVLRRHDVFVDAPCSGQQRCGKCKITVKNHGYTLNEKELSYLTDNEEASNTILACFHTVDRNLDIYPAEENDTNEIETGYQAFKVKEAKYEAQAYMKANYPIGIGIDIGTTTLAVSLINLVTHEVLDIRKRLNPQKAYGADVISRIMYVQEHQDGKLSTLIRENIEAMSQELIDSKGYNPAHIEAMVISGNTTMIYLLLGIDPAALAVAPFTTIDMQMKVCDSMSLFKKLGTFEVTILPWISAYVGGDIVSGLFATHMIDKDETIVFVDIGTNGEMVLKTGGRLLSAATAAGPAFEGANIKCGMGSINGAICEIRANGEGYDLETLGNSKAIGICGSALIDAVALLHQQGYVDDMGFMEKPMMFKDEIGIYPEDIRQVQLAKAAISAGIEVLLSEAGITYKDIDAFYLAGGFGSHLNVENSAYIGLIPKEVADKVTVVGNSSLAGSVRYLLEVNGAKEVEALRTTCEYIELSSNMKFNEAYVMGMTFGDLEW